MSPSVMPTERDSLYELRASDAGGTETITEQLPWPFAPSRAPSQAEEVEEDLLEERPELTGYDATVDASFPASDPPPSPIAHFGHPEKQK